MTRPIVRELKTKKSLILVRTHVIQNVGRKKSMFSDRTVKAFEIRDYQPQPQSTTQCLVVGYCIKSWGTKSVAYLALSQ